MECALWEHPTFRFLFAHWKIGLHLTFHTKRFGVNNKWWSSFDSVIGWPTWKIFLGIITIKPIIMNVKAALIRAFALGFMAPEERIYMIPVMKYLGKFMDLSNLDFHLKMTVEHYNMLPEERKTYGKENFGDPRVGHT